MWFTGLLPAAAAHISPSGGNIYKYMPRTFQRTYAISYVATFGQRERERERERGKLSISYGVIYIYIYIYIYIRI